MGDTMIRPQGGVKLKKQGQDHALIGGDYPRKNQKTIEEY